MRASSWPRRSVLGSLAAVVPVWLLSTVTAAADPPGVVEARAVTQAYLANVDSFTQFTCRFDCTFTRADSVEDALAGRYIGPENRTGKILWVKDGNNISSKVVEDEKTSRELDKPKLQPFPGRPNLMSGPAVPFMSGEDLSNGTENVTFDTRLKTANIQSHGRPHRLGHFLFGCYGCRNNSDPVIELIKDLDAGRPEVTVTRVAQKGRDLLKVAVDHGKQRDGRKTGVWEYWFAPDRGYQLVRCGGHRADRVENHEWAEYPDPRECPNGRWFPGRVIGLVKQNTSPGWAVWDSKVTDLEVDTKPAREHFEIAMPAGTRVIEFGSPLGHTFRTRKAEKIHIDDLPNLYRMTQEIPSNPLADTAIVPAASYRWAWWVLGAAATLLAVIGLRTVALKRLATRAE